MKENFSGKKVLFSDEKFSENNENRSNFNVFWPPISFHDNLTIPDTWINMMIKNENKNESKDKVIDGKHENENEFKNLYDNKNRNKSDNKNKNKNLNNKNKFYDGNAHGFQNSYTQNNGISNLSNDDRTTENDYNIEKKKKNGIKYDSNSTGNNNDNNNEYMKNHKF